jgi:hypothetical protein
VIVLGFFVPDCWVLCWRPRFASGRLGMGGDGVGVSERKRWEVYEDLTGACHDCCLLCNELNGGWSWIIWIRECLQFNLPVYGTRGMSTIRICDTIWCYLSKLQLQQVSKQVPQPTGVNERALHSSRHAASPFTLDPVA